MPREESRDLDQLRLPELQARYREIVGQGTRCPNRTFLVRRIRETLEAAASAPAPNAERRPRRPATRVTAARQPRSKTVKPAKAKRSKGPAQQRGRFTSMTVTELQTLYASTVGRPTDSSDHRYLIWKIREAEKGRIPIGPRATRSPDQEAHTDMRILPLRIEAAGVAAIDGVWKKQGMKSRMDFFRRALGHFLAHVGAREAASLFASP